MCKVFLTSAKFYHNPNSSIIMHFFFQSLIREVHCALIYHIMVYISQMLRTPKLSRKLENSPNTVSLPYRNE